MKPLLRFFRWKKGKSGQGYSVLLPAPAEFSQVIFINLQALQKCNLRDCREILLMSDAFSPNLEHDFNIIRDKIDMPCPVRLKKCSFKYRPLISLKKSAHWIHGLQILEGINALETEYLLLHDADFFMLDRDYYNKAYEQAKEKDMYLLALQPRNLNLSKNRPARVGATWELFIKKEFAFQFDPWDFLAREIRISSKKVAFDTMLWTQYQYIKKHGPARVQIQEHPPNHIHLSYTFGEFRRLLREKEYFIDRHLRIFLLTYFNVLFMDIFSPVAALPNSFESYFREVHFDLSLTGTEGFSQDFNNIKKEMLKLRKACLMEYDKDNLLEKNLHRLEKTKKNT